MKTSYLFSFGLVLCSIGATLAQLKPQPVSEKVVIDRYYDSKSENRFNISIIHTTLKLPMEKLNLLDKSEERICDLMFFVHQPDRTS